MLFFAKIGLDLNFSNAVHTELSYMLSLGVDYVFLGLLCISHIKFIGSIDLNRFTKKVKCSRLRRSILSRSEYQNIFLTVNRGWLKHFGGLRQKLNEDLKFLRKK